MVVSLISPDFAWPSRGYCAQHLKDLETWPEPVRLGAKVITTRSKDATMASLLGAKDDYLEQSPIDMNKSATASELLSFRAPIPCLSIALLSRLWHSLQHVLISMSFPGKDID